MKSWRSHFVFNKSERNGIFLLVLFIITLQGIYFYVIQTPKADISEEQREAIKDFQRQLDSLKSIGSEEDSSDMYPFNPNFISDFKGYTLGMSVEEIDRLHAFRASERWVNSAAEFQEVTGVSDSLLKKIAPFFKFPEWKSTVAVGSENSRKSDTYVSPSAGAVQDLNTSSAEALMEVRGVGEVLSRRIVKYRESIGGFRDEIQLQDVYGLSPEVVEEILKFFKIESAAFEKQDLNKISVVSLSEIPGFSYELAREVIEARTRQNGFSTFEELRNIKGFPVEKIDRIQLYLTIE